MSSDWYARRMAQQNGQPPPPRQPPPYPQAPVGMQQQQPVGYLADGTPIYAAPPQQQQQPQYPQQQGYQQPGQPPIPLNEADFIKAAIKGDQGITPMDALNRAGAKGGKGSRTETEQCPECGGNQYFQRKALSKFGKPPAPYCHSCGYNGMYEQYGSQDIPFTGES